MWDVWKNLFMEVLIYYKHAPHQNERVSNKHSPWITHELTLFKKITRGLGSDISKLETK